MPKMMRFSMPSAQAETPEEQDGILLTATVTPDNDYNKTVDWSVAFSEPDNFWASGKNASDYVSVTPTEDGSLSAYVKCLQPFDNPIFVTVTSRVDAKKSATCQVDYMKRAGMITYRVEDYRNPNPSSAIPYCELEFYAIDNTIYEIDVMMSDELWPDWELLHPVTTVTDWQTGTIESNCSFELHSEISEGLVEQFEKFGVDYYGGNFTPDVDDFREEFFAFSFHAYALESVFGTPADGWGTSFINSIKNNPDAYDFKLVLTVTYVETGLIETREMLFKLNPDSLIRIDEITLSNGNIIF